MIAIKLCISNKALAKKIKKYLQVQEVQGNQISGSSIAMLLWYMCIGLLAPELQINDQVELFKKIRKSVIAEEVDVEGVVADGAAADFSLEGAAEKIVERLQNFKGKGIEEIIEDWIDAQPSAQARAKARAKRLGEWGRKVVL